MKKTEFIAGIQSGTPVILGYIPIGIAYGMMAAHAHLPLTAIMSLSLFVYTGAGEMAAVGMISQGATIMAIVITTFILNLRMIIQSTCVMNKLKNGNRLERAILSFWITDETFAVYMTDKNVKPTKWFFFGLGLTCWLSWAVGSFIGAIATDVMPATLSKALGISLYAMFIALLVPSAKKSVRLLAVILLTACISLVCNQFFSSSTSIIIATLSSALLGMLWVKKEDFS